MRQSRSLKAVLFDFDGTLVDTIGAIVSSYRHTYRSFGLPVPEEAEIIAGIGLPLETVFARVQPERVVEMLQCYVAHNVRILDEQVGIFVGILPLLQQLREAGLKLGIVSAKRLPSLSKTLDFFELRPYFECLVCKEDTERHKPDPEPLLLGMKKLGLTEAQSVAYVGDAVYDLEAAHRAGMLAVQVAWSQTEAEALAAAKPDLILRRAEDLLSFCQPGLLCV